MTIQHRLFPLLAFFLCGSVLIAGCRTSDTQLRQVVILADGQEIALSTQLMTVGQVLDEVGITIDGDDQVRPDTWVELADGMTVRVIRVREETVIEREIVPYGQQVVRSESLPSGEQQLAQAGKNGEAEITYRVRIEDGVEVTRSILRRVIVEEPVEQITVVGIAGMLESASFEGVIAYLTGGNAWLMRGTTAGREPVTDKGNLDGHAFDLSADGRTLLYTTSTESAAFDGPFNDLYVLDVGLVGETPRRLPIHSVLWAGWSPDGRSIAYTTGIKSGPPGWKANNDLWVVRLFDQAGRYNPDQPRLIREPEEPDEYSRWGTRYAWSPDGAKIAYARPDQLGWIDVASRRAFPLASFAPLDVRGDWGWVPRPSWSPDSWFVVSAIHVEEAGHVPEASQRFEVWAFDIAREVRARLTSQPVGMWSEPCWSPDQDGESTIAYAQADDPENSYESRYALHLVDRDGSDARQVYPREGKVGVGRPIVYTWSPDGDQVLFLYLGDLYVIDVPGGRTQRLTGDGQCTHLDWAE